MADSRGWKEDGKLPTDKLPALKVPGTTTSTKAIPYLPDFHLSKRIPASSSAMVRATHHTLVAALEGKAVGYSTAPFTDETCSE